MQKKIISIVLCLAMVVTMLAFALPTAGAAEAGNTAVGVSKIESADDFSWDNLNLYFLLTDRFYNGNTSNDHSYGRALDANGQPLSGWQTNPGTFHGGDFAGITKKINEGYFDDLGVNAIWISAPYEQIHGYVTPGDPNDFAHYSYHGYYVLDYTETDANFGTKAEFKTMVDTAHSHGIRVVLDIVMNHAGYNTIKDMLEFNFGSFKDQAAATSYLYKLTGVNGLHSTVDYDNTEETWGRWWGTSWIRSGLPGYEKGGGEVTGMLAGLPDFRTESTQQVSIPQFLKTKWEREGTYQAKTAKYGATNTVSEYISSWLAQWVEDYGVDGFRCDTAKHVEMESWVRLKNKCKTALSKWRQNNPSSPGAEWDEDFWMTGECWGHKLGKDNYFTSGAFDSMINFEVTSDVSSNPGGLTGPESIDGMYSRYANEINSDPSYNMLTYLSSHDTGLVRQNPYWQGTAFLLLPGGIQIFYGDETSRALVSGVPVGGDGHAVRSDMNFGQNADLLAHWQKVGKFRTNHIAVGAGDHRVISAYNASTGYTFARTYEDDNVSDAVVCCIGAPKNTQITIDVGSVFAAGKTVTNEYDGSTAVVQNGKVTFNSGAQGVILLSGPQSSIHMSLKGKTSFYDTQTLSVSLRGANYAMVSVAGGTPFRVVDGQTFTIGEGIEVGTTFEVRMTASNAEDSAESTYTYKKKDPDAVTRIYFDNTSYNWGSVNAYIYDDTATSKLENGVWPGEGMEPDSETGLYVYEVPDELAENGLVIFNGGDSQYPGSQQKGLAIGGNDMLLINKTTWKVYEGEKVEPPAPGTQRTIYLDTNKVKASNPKCYVWVKGTKDDLDIWPGTDMTKAPEMGEGIYKFTCDAKYNCCIFCDGSSKLTSDLENIPYTDALWDGAWKEIIPEGTQPTEPTKPTNPTNPTDPTDPEPPHGRWVLIGDANLDGKVTISDVTDIQRHCAEVARLKGDALITADADADGYVDIKDATNIQAFVVELEIAGNQSGEMKQIEEEPTTPTQPTTPTLHFQQGRRLQQQALGRFGEHSLHLRDL